MRLFVAVPFDKPMRQALTTAKRKLLRSGFNGNFSRVENLHLTLAFIGEYRDEKPVIQALTRVEALATELVTQELGHFGDLIWLGVKRDPALEDLAYAVRKSLQEAGIPCDSKAFRPHITLARRTNIERRLQVQPFPIIPPQRMPVSHFSLMCSERINGKLIYRELKSFSLNDKSVSGS